MSWTTRFQTGYVQATCTRRGDDPWLIPWEISLFLAGGGDQGVPGEGATHLKPCKATIPLGFQELRLLVPRIDMTRRMKGECSRLMSWEKQKEPIQSPMARTEIEGEEHKNWTMEIY
jgi:hypothetical protein